MKKIFRTGIASGALLTWLPVSGLAQGAPPATPAQPPITERPTVVAPTPSPDRPPSPPRPERPAVPGQPAPSQEIKDLTRNFQAARQAFVKQQQELQRQFKTATDEQRKLIRQQLKENLEQWMEQQRQQMKDTVSQIKELAPGLRDVGNNPHDGRGR
jgi:gas vesicle protein